MRAMTTMAAALAVAACARQGAIASDSRVNAVSPANASALPVGTSLDVTLDDEIGTKVSHVGETFTATVIRPVVATNGDIAVPTGSKVHGTVVGVDNSDYVGEPAAIKVDFTRLVVNGGGHSLGARVAETEVRTRGGDSRTETLRRAGVGAAAGAVIGAVLSGGEIRDILKGGAIGAAAGTVISLGTGSVEAVLPAGTRMQLETTRTVSLRADSDR